VAQTGRFRVGPAEELVGVFALGLGGALAGAPDWQAASTQNRPTAAPTVARLPALGTWVRRIASDE
jgi:hypothetical protein